MNYLWLDTQLFKVGSKNEGSQEQRIEDVQGALFKLPKVHLYVLDAVIKHVKTYVSYLSFQKPFLRLSSLVNSTKSEEVRHFLVEAEPY